MKKIISILVFLIVSVSVFSIDKKLEMRNLILKIRDDSPENFIIIPQNGVGIYFDEEGVEDQKLIDAIDGIGQESYRYGYPKYGKKTPKSERENFVEEIELLKEQKKVIMTINYTKSMWGTWKSRKEAANLGHINYNARDREVTEINENVINENSDDVLKLSEAKNFLYLLNPEKFKKKSEYIDALSKSKYDLLLIDLNFHGKQLTKKDIEKLKTKPQGGKRLIIGYFSIGEAEDYREYWKKEWSENLPKWIRYENEDWEGNYIVEYWSEEWKEIIKNILNKYVDSGYDGVYLDTIDTYKSDMEVDDE